MKKFKKTLAVLSAFTTLAVYSAPVFAENVANESKKYDFTFDYANSTYNCTLDDAGIAFDSSSYCNGIVFETEDGIDIKDYNLKYDFSYSNAASWGTAGLNTSIVLGHNTSHSENVHSCHVDGDVSQLKDYANELSKMDGIKYAEVFTIDVNSKGTIVYSQKDDCHILIKGGSDPKEYMEKLNKNKGLIEYLSGIGADPEVKMMEKTSEEDDAFLYVSGIKDRTQYFDIYSKLSSFEDIGNNAIMLENRLVSPTAAVDFIGRDYTGDANGDKYINVRDSAFIASALANNSELPDTADYNKDGRKNIRDAAAMAKDIASGKI